MALWVIGYTAGAIGVNWGTMSSHPLPPLKVVELLKSNSISKVKLFDADPLVLQALSGYNIVVTVGIPNSMLKTLNSGKKAAQSWVHDNVTRYSSHAGAGVRIEYVAVADEPFVGMLLLNKNVLCLTVLRCLPVAPVPISVGLVIYPTHLIATISSMIKGQIAVILGGWVSSPLSIHRLVTADILLNFKILIQLLMRHITF